jgi:hypothetical protein
MRKIGTLTLGLPLVVAEHRTSRIGGSSAVLGRFELGRDVVVAFPLDAAEASDLGRSSSTRPAKVTAPFGDESRQSVVELRQPLTAVGPKHAIGGPRRSKP